MVTLHIPYLLTLKRGPALLRILLVLLFWPCVSLADSTVLPLRPVFTVEQRDWLQNHEELRVGLIMQAPWAQFDRRQQRLTGANVDLMNRLLQGMGGEGAMAAVY